MFFFSSSKECNSEIFFFHFGSVLEVLDAEYLLDTSTLQGVLDTSDLLDAMVFWTQVKYWTVIFWTQVDSI